MKEKVTDSPYTVICDTREQAPFDFARPIKIAPGNHRQLVSTRGTLKSGDYSIVGLTDRIVVERKSLTDLYGTLGRGRRRFEAELTRMQAIDFSAVVVESELSTALNSPPPRSRLSPFSVLQSVLAWHIRYPRTHWWWCPGRDGAEAVTAWLLERYWRTTQERPATTAPAAPAASIEDPV